MKSFKKVQEDRIQYHRNPEKFSVHRSSLLIPIIENFDTTISFLNHFLIKRNNDSVSLKVSAYSKEGNIIDSFYEEIKEKRVYEFNLTKIFSHHKNLSSFQGEFYSSKNLFIPFPAVIVQHVSNHNRNIIHSYNRVLNDISEENKINNQQNYESSFEAIKTNESCTGFIFQSGQENVNGKLKIEISYENKKQIYTVPTKLSPFSSKFFSLKKYLKRKNKFYFCRILQPKQKMFFGRILVGPFSENSKYFSANHSFYDSSATKEFFNNSTSYRQYPYFKGYQNTLKFYPINGNSKLDVFLKVNNDEFLIGNITSPSKNFLDININNYFEKYKINSDTYTLLVKSKTRVPTRVNHQLIVGKPESHFPISINISLLNDEIYNPVGKKAYIWGITQYNKNYNSILSILGKHPSDFSKCTLSIYSKEGLIHSKKITISKSSCLKIDNDFFKNLGINNKETLWYSVESKNQNLQAFTIFTNKKTGISSGEHNF